MKTVLVLVDGMRPDSMAGIPFVEKMLADSTYSLNARTVFPSVTLPCHMSLFHSVTPERHGVTTNTFTPQVRPIDGLCECLDNAGENCAFFYNWGELRDLTKPGSLVRSIYVSGGACGFETANEQITAQAIEYMSKHSPDFVFLYLGLVDGEGHSYGWMSDKYMASVRLSWNEIERVSAILEEDDNLIVTADHGGHDRSHGTNDDSDMLIPIFYRGKAFERGKVLENASILDIAPTIAGLFGAKCPPEWDGKSIL